MCYLHFTIINNTHEKFNCNCFKLCFRNLSIQFAEALLAPPGGPMTPHHYKSRLIRPWNVSPPPHWQMWCLLWTCPSRSFVLRDAPTLVVSGCWRFWNNLATFNLHTSVFVHVTSVQLFVTVSNVYVVFGDLNYIFISLLRGVPRMPGTEWCQQGALLLCRPLMTSLVHISCTSSAAGLICRVCSHLRSWCRRRCRRRHETDRLQDEAERVCRLLLQHKQKESVKRHQPGVLWLEVHTPRPAVTSGTCWIRNKTMEHLSFSFAAACSS